MKLINVYTGRLQLTTDTIRYVQQNLGKKIFGEIISASLCNVASVLHDTVCDYVHLLCDCVCVCFVVLTLLVFMWSHVN
jgi:hypothetical protein